MSEDLSIDGEAIQAIVRSLQQEASKLRATDDKPWMQDFDPERMLGMFPKQKAFVTDESPFKCALCGRRSGKTEGEAFWLLDGAYDSPGEMSVYVALRRNQARNVLWNTLKRIDRRYHLGLDFKEIDKQLMIVCPGQHVIWLAGCDDYAEIEKFRGPRYYRAAIDEAASYGEYLQELVEDVLEPALMDLGGQLALVGTPGARLGGYFFDVTTGKNPDIPRWPTHHWTALDNPYLPNPGAFFESVKKKRGWTDDTPRFLREYRGLWVHNDDALVFPFNIDRNGYEVGEGAYKLPQPDDDQRGHVDYVLGVDFGWHSHTAFVVLANERGSPYVVVVESFQKREMLPPTIAAHIDRLMGKYDFSHIVCDTGNLGKSIMEDFRRNFGLPVRAAEKKDKMTAITQFSAGLKSGQIKVDRWHNRELLAEWSILQWNEEYSDFADGFSDDLSDATVYAARALHVNYAPELEGPKEGTKEWYEAEEERFFQQYARRVLKPRRQWWMMS